MTKGQPAVAVWLKCVVSNHSQLIREDRCPRRMRNCNKNARALKRKTKLYLYGFLPLCHVSLRLSQANSVARVDGVVYI